MKHHRALATLVGLGAVAFAANPASAHCTEPGTCHDAFDDCVDAPLGFWSDGEICFPCEPGQYADTKKSTMCKPCAAGTFAAALASTSCLPCAADTYSLAASSACSACGGCDDTIACTVDRCEPTKGCVNEAMSGCDAGVADAVPMGDGAADQDGRPEASDPGGCGCATPGSRAPCSPGILLVAAFFARIRRRRARERSR